ncbi:hypothetical protein AB0N09_34620 [Streptomyces erythrochromogenes]|uniref:hypothetical protein n=1 Tax=Streptomyces erythrochromogenes TaxID=285574 RepID=UPI003438CC76
MGITAATARTVRSTATLAPAAARLVDRLAHDTTTGGTPAAGKSSIVREDGDARLTPSEPADDSLVREGGGPLHTGRAGECSPAAATAPVPVLVSASVR